MFRKKILPLADDKFGKILKVYLGEAFPDEEFDNPTNSELEGTPQYTYLWLLDSWYMMNRNPNFNGLSEKDKVEFVCNVRGYYRPEEIEELLAMPVNDYRDAILSIIDYEFGKKFAAGNDGNYKDVRPKFVSMIEGLEEDYLKVRKDSKI
ncbi:hypothetical protein KDA00_02295 [Candidatus Saccharibacteria bacterium]|nr:hypothetical protein [Candidatus Saccharibacteria bacterium]